MERYIEKSIDIDVPAEILWKILTDNDYIPQYMFGCKADSDWKPGSPLLWVGAADGKLYVKGSVVTFNKPQLLEYTVIDPNNHAVADIPENYLTMTFRIEPRRENTATLHIRQGDYSTVANGEQRYNDTISGDDTWLLAIKKIAESL